LERIVRVPRRPAPWTFLGSAVHVAVAEWELSRRSIDPVKSYYDEYDRLVEEGWKNFPDWRDWIVPPATQSVSKTIARYRKRGGEMDVPTFIQRCEEEEDWWQIAEIDGELAVEVDVSLPASSSPGKTPLREMGAGIILPPFEHPEVVGIIDQIRRYEEEDGSFTYRLVDIKSGNVTDYANDNRQLKLYMVMAPVRCTKARYEFTKTGRQSKWLEWNESFEVSVKEDYSILDRAVEEGIYLPRPGDHCKVCSSKPWCREVQDEST